MVVNNRWLTVEDMLSSMLSGQASLFFDVVSAFVDCS